MTLGTRRGLLGGAALGPVALAACQTTPKAAPGFEGELAFQHGVASGDPLPDRVILWTRVTPLSGTGPVTVKWDVTEAGAAAPAASGEFVTSEARDYTVKVDATGLKPATEYTYRFAAIAADGAVLSPEGRTRTTAANGTAPVKLGVVSCPNWQFGLFSAHPDLSTQHALAATVPLGVSLSQVGTDPNCGTQCRQTGT